MKIIATILTLILLSCGIENGDPGKDGIPGEDGKPGEPGEDGKPGDSALTKSYFCNLDWDYENGGMNHLQYSVIKYSNGSAASSLYRHYVKDDYEVQYNMTSIWAKGSGLEDTAPVVNGTIKAELNGERAVFSRLNFNERKVVDCEIN